MVSLFLSLSHTLCVFYFNQIFCFKQQMVHFLDLCALFCCFGCLSVLCQLQWRTHQDIHHSRPLLWSLSRRLFAWHMLWSACFDHRCLSGRSYWILEHRAQVLLSQSDLCSICDRIDIHEWTMESSHDFHQRPVSDFINDWLIPIACYLLQSFLGASL